MAIFDDDKIFKLLEVSLKNWDLWEEEILFKTGKDEQTCQVEHRQNLQAIKKFRHAV